MALKLMKDQLHAKHYTICQIPHRDFGKRECMKFVTHILMNEQKEHTATS